MFVELVKKYDDFSEEELEKDNDELEEGELGVKYFDKFPTISELAYRIVKFTNRADEIAYMMPYKIDQFKSLSNMEKEYKQLVYYRNEEDKMRGVDYVMNKILGFYKECLELGPEYLTGLDESSSSVRDEGVT
ncbi:hypothetical protein Tco_0730220 [Tanacetum coccineum]|uniref:Uncharacterized protein n=1 Tax=Tanacetum coccineum TaxID=301880 RepID=A0ABQ4YR61_9ASTR